MKMKKVGALAQAPPYLPCSCSDYASRPGDLRYIWMPSEANSDRAPASCVPAEEVLLVTLLASPAANRFGAVQDCIHLLNVVD